MIVTFSEKSTPIYEIAFPTVTICTDIKIRKTNFNYGAVWQELNDTEKYRKFPNISDVEKLYVLSPLCDELPAYLNEYIEMKNLSQRLADADARFWRMAKRYAPTIKDVLTNCKWRHDPQNCSELFHEVLTDDGICFSFNLQNASELYKEEAINEHYHITRHNKPSHLLNNIPPNITEDMIYPRRVLTGSEGLRFELILPGPDKIYECSGPVQSFKIQLHSSDDHPQMHRNFYRIPMSHDIIMSVHPNIMNSTVQLIQNFNQWERQCVAHGDRELHFFKKYTQRNCQLQALAYRQKKTCKCVKYGLPRYKDSSICRSSINLKCIEHLESETVLNIFNGSQISFNCIPSCQSISYDAEISMSEFEHVDYEQNARKKFNQKKKDSKKSRVLITFKDEQFFASRRAEMYSTTDFIASCGGILGEFNLKCNYSMMQI